MIMTDLLRRISVEASKSNMDNRPSVRHDGKALVPDTTPMTSTIRWGVGWSKQDMRRMYLEKGLAFKILNKYTNDCFNYWFEIHSDKPDLIEAIKAVNSTPSKYKENTKYKELDVKRIIRNSGMMTFKYGYCPVFIGFGETEGNEQELSQPMVSPGKTTPVMVLQATPAINVTKIEIDNSLNSENYGDIKSYRVKSKTSSPVIDASRMLHTQVFFDDNAVEGVPVLGPGYNYIQIWEDFIWAVGKGFFRFGMGFPHKKINADVWAQMDDEDKAREANLMKNINVMTGFVGPNDEDITFPGVAGSAVNPTPYEEVILDAISMSIGMPRTVLRGLVTGAITGSEVDEREWANTVRGIQELVWTPILEELYKLMQQTGQIPDGEFTIKWNSIIHDTDKDVAQIKKTNAETRFIEQKTGLITKDTQESISSGELIIVDPLQTNTNTFGADKKDAHNSMEKIDFQTLIFSKERFEDKERVIKWINENDFKMTKGIEETDTSFIVWQRDKEDFLNVPFKTETLTDGISAIVSVLKDPNEGPFFFSRNDGKLNDFEKVLVKTEKVGNVFYDDLKNLLSFVETNIVQRIMKERSIKKTTDAYTEEELAQVLKEYTDIINQEMKTFTKESQAISRSHIREGALTTVIGLNELLGDKIIKNLNSDMDKELLSFFRKSTDESMIGLSSDISKSVLQQLEDDFLAGTGERKIIKNIQGYFKNTQIVVPEQRVAGKVVRKAYTRVVTAKSRAQLAARMSIKKVYDKFAEQRYRAAGLNRFTYLTAGDNRVRLTHAHMQGRTFNYGSRDYNVARSLLSEPNCRCQIIPVFK